MARPIWAGHRHPACANLIVTSPHPTFLSSDPAFDNAAARAEHRAKPEHWQVACFR
jgi:hypothetical protein